MNRSKRCVYVGGIAEGVTSADLKAAFIPFGNILDLIIMESKSGAAAGTGGQKGKTGGGKAPLRYGFVEFEEEEDAAAAIANMHETEFFRQVLVVSPVRDDAVLDRAAAASSSSSSSTNGPVWLTDEYAARMAAAAAAATGNGADNENDNDDDDADAAAAGGGGGGANASKVQVW